MTVESYKFEELQSTLKNQHRELGENHIEISLMGKRVWNPSNGSLEKDTYIPLQSNHHQETIVNIYLMDNPISGRGNEQEGTYSYHFLHWGKSLCEINHLMPCFPKNDNSGFKFFNNPIDFMLDLVDPLTSEGLLAWGQRS